MTPFTITHSSGVRSLDVYEVLPRARSYAVAARGTRGGLQARVDGDLKEVPSVYGVRLLMDEASLGAAFTLAYEVIAEANDATEVASYEGALLVEGIVNASVQVDGVFVFLTLEFAPTQPGYQP